jgi:hypothetical protein
MKCDETFSSPSVSVLLTGGVTSGPCVLASNTREHSAPDSLTARQSTTSRCVCAGRFRHPLVRGTYDRFG